MTYIKLNSCTKCTYFKEDKFGNFICNYGKNRKITKKGECLNFEKNPFLTVSTSTEIEY